MLICIDLTLVPPSAPLVPLLLVVTLVMVYEEIVAPEMFTPLVIH